MIANAQQATSEHLARHGSVKALHTSTSNSGHPLPLQVHDSRPNRLSNQDRQHQEEAETAASRAYRTAEGGKRDQRNGNHLNTTSTHDVVPTGYREYSISETLTVISPDNPSRFTAPRNRTEKSSMVKRQSESFAYNPREPLPNKRQSNQSTNSQFVGPGSQTASANQEQELQVQKEPVNHLTSYRNRLSKFNTRSTSQLVNRWNGDVRGAHNSQEVPTADHGSVLRHHQIVEAPAASLKPVTDFRGLLKHYSPPREQPSTSLRKMPSTPAFALSREPATDRSLEHQPSNLAKTHSVHRSRASMEGCEYCELGVPFGSLSSVPEQEPRAGDQSPDPPRGRPLSRHSSAIRGSSTQPSSARREPKPLRRVQPRDSKEWANHRAIVEQDPSSPSPPTSAYATGESDGEASSSTITGTSPRVTEVKRPMPYRLSDHDCE